MKARLFLASLLLLFCFFPAHHVMAQNKRILILTSGTLDPFQQAISGFKKGLRDGHIPAEFSEHNLSEKASSILDSAFQFNPDLIFAVGSPAAKLAQEKFVDKPIVFSMVLYPSISNIGNVEQTPNVTGIAMDVPIQRQFQAIVQIVPEAKTVGVLYNPKETGKLIAEATEVCRQMSLQLLAIPVNSTSEVPAALDGIERKIDVLWSVADSTVFNGKMPEYILQYTLQHDLPFMGLSTNFVEAGALFGLSQDYPDMGAQAAELAIRIFAGAKANELTVAAPRRVLLWLNLRAADEIGIRIPDAVIRQAARVLK